MPRRVLVSVSDKTGLDRLVPGLAALGFEVVSTGGTAKYIRGLGVPVVDLSEYTGFPEILDGRVKTLHPRVHGGLLGRPDLPHDAAQMKQHGIIPFELVVVNLYPFAETIAKPDVTIDEAIENIDIGGPSMIRGAAKNHAYVAVITEPSQYEPLLVALQAGQVTPEFRRQLAAAAFAHTARYDRLVADYLERITAPADERFPGTLRLEFRRQETLRYGENPHQGAAFYTEPAPASGTLASARQLHGKDLSYNNLLDLDAALNLVREFAEPAAIVIKHNNPCGAALGETLADAFRKALAGDPVSAFGSVLSFNRPVDLATAEELCRPDRFVEAIMAPGYEPAAFDALTTRPKWKANVRLLECAGLNDFRKSAWEYRRVTGGLLVQDADDQLDPEGEWQVVTSRQPSPAELADLKFAWKVTRHVKSNAIVLAQGGQVVGVGAGQMSRLDSVQIAVTKAGERNGGTVLGSDAFFPFRDGVDAAARAGVKAIIQPGGSRNDKDAISACDEQGLAMIFTGRRHFRH